jgi:LysR family transcriptional activator of nhaA
MRNLNYHHLYHFWAVAKKGNLTRTAELLRVSQSALSKQIQLLEADLGHPLFDRKGKSMQLTEAGRLALNYADSIFATGDELIARLRDGRTHRREVVRIGAIATLSRNFQENFIRPLLQREDIKLVLQSGSQTELLSKLSVHNLDLILSNQRVVADDVHAWRCRKIARQAISLVGKPRKTGRVFRFPKDLNGRSMLLPSAASGLRAGFDLLCENLDLRPQVLAEVDDMAMLRLLSRDTDAIALVPSVVVQDELRNGTLEEYCVIPQLQETFYAITIKRQFETPLLRELLRRAESEMSS